MFLIDLTFTNLKRQFRKSILVLLLCSVMVCFLCSYIGNINANESQLSSLPQAIPVSAFISNLNGSQNVGLQIKDSIINGIEASGFARDMVYRVQMAANFAPETEEEQIKPKKIQLAGINDISAYPSIDENSLNGEMDFFNGQSAQCIVTKRFLQDNGLKIGDEIKLAMYRYQYENNMFGTLKYVYLADESLKISGSFDLIPDAVQEVMPNVIAPISWIKSIFNEKGVDFYAESASFKLTDPMHLNEFKASMKELSLLPVNPQTDNLVSGNALVVNDETFIRSATSIQNNLKALNYFFPLLIAAVLMVGYVVSNLMIQSRQREFAIMRSLGNGKFTCLSLYLIESSILALTSAVIGVFVALLFMKVPLLSVLTASITFFMSFMLGVFIATIILGRVSVMNMLSKAD
ncbi:MAG: ABC transporter permease [Oscillospiraceae bacterium]|nr:ABC transporter permease [Oscillospiraceae bacterium]